MMITSCYNIFGNAYYAAFGAPQEFYDVMIDNFVEVLFFLDMIFCFCQEYMDEETYNLVSGFKSIALHYAKQSFIFDFIAWFPVDLLVDTKEDFGEKGRLFRILRLLRLPRLA